MNSIIKILQEATAPMETGPKARERSKAAAPYWAALEQAFPVAWIDEFDLAASDVWEAEVDEAYERGFRNASQLWMEVFARYSS